MTLFFRSMGGEGFEEMMEPQPWMSHHEHHLMILRNETDERGSPVECCPTVREMVAPEGGKNQEGMYVELFR